MTCIRLAHTILVLSCLAPLASFLSCTTPVARAQSPAAPAAGPSLSLKSKHAEDLPEYIDWLEHRSMLKQSEEMARSLSGKGAQWKHEFAEPQPRAAIRQASVWLLSYPGSVITRPGESVIATWADTKLWDALSEIGINLLHTGPVNLAGGIVDREYTPTVDGLFDPISLEIDPALGSEKDYRRMVRLA